MMLVAFLFDLEELNMHNGLIFCLILSGLVLGGCVRKEEETVFAIVDGWPLTATYVSNRVMLVAEVSGACHRLKHPNQFAHWANDKAMKMIPSLISERILNCELERQAIQPEKEDFEPVLAIYRKSLKMNDAGLETLADRFGVLKNVFLEKVKNEARFRAYVRTRPECSVSDEEVSERIEDLRRQKARVYQFNLLAKGRGKSAYDELKKGASWDAVVKKYSEDHLRGSEESRFGTEWGEFVPGGTGFEQLDKVLPKLKSGGFSVPLETDDGLLIVKVNEISVSGAYVLSRIMIRLLCDIEIPNDKEMVRNSIYAENFNAVQSELLGSLRKKVKIEYLLGKRFRYALWNIATPPAKKKANAK